MARQKQDTETTDARGNVHKHYTDGRSEIYYKGKHAAAVDLAGDFMEITDDADKAVNRRRFMPWTKTAKIEDTLETRDADEAIPGLDLDTDEPGDNAS